MYESYFNLSIKPFDLHPDPRFIYLSSSHKKAMAYLDYGIRERSGFILLTGEVGSGKTTLIRDLLDKHYENVVLSMIFNTRVTSEQLLAMINEDFGLTVHGKDKVTLIRDLNGFLIDQFAAGNQPILIIDEAQNLSAELLEEVRMLSNLEASNSKLLQIILVGQPELRTLLASPELRQLRQRISINCHLKALSRDELANYIDRRLEVAGNPRAVSFQPDALDALFRYSRGIPRLINIICDFLMFLAYAEETRSLSATMVQDVIGDLDFENHYWVAEEQTTNRPAAAATPPSDALQGLLLEISQRIDAIQHSIAEPLHQLLNEQNKKFETLQSSMLSATAETRNQINSLNRGFEELRNLVNKQPGATVPVPALPKSDFDWRMFGSDISPRKKS